MIVENRDGKVPKAMAARSPWRDGCCGSQGGMADALVLQMVADPTTC